MESSSSCSWLRRKTVTLSPCSGPLDCAYGITILICTSNEGTQLAICSSLNRSYEHLEFGLIDLPATLIASGLKAANPVFAGITTLLKSDRNWGPSATLVFRGLRSAACTICPNLSSAYCAESGGWLREMIADRGAT